MMKRYELITLVLAFAFGLFGAWLHVTFGEAGEYIALFVCIPPPALYYLYGYMKNADPKKGAGDKSQSRSG